MNEQEIKAALLHLCKPSNLDSDFNVTAFHVLCRKLKQLGVADEREACAKVCDEMEEKAEEHGTECCKWPTPSDCAFAIRARGDK